MNSMLADAKHQAARILMHSNSEPNELMIGLLHFVILPFAMLELGEPLLILQISASLVGLFQLYSVLFDGSLEMRKWSAQAACMIAASTVVNYSLVDMLHGSHLSWLLIFGFSIWNCYRLNIECRRLLQEAMINDKSTIV